MPRDATLKTARRKHLTWTSGKSTTLIILVSVGILAYAASYGFGAAVWGAVGAAALLALWAFLFLFSLPVRIACMRGVAEDTVTFVQLGIFVGIWFGTVGWWVAMGIALFSPENRFDWYASQKTPFLL